MASTPDWQDLSPDATLMEQLVAMSRRYGRDERFVIAGGGNTSAKTDDTLYVKASGHSLGEIDADGFVPMNRTDLNALLCSEVDGKPAQREARVKQAMLAARRDPADTRCPSVEALLHHLLNDTFVAHTHPTLVNAVACCGEGKTIVEELFGDEVLWVPFVEPGYVLAQTVRDGLATLRAAGKPAPKAILMQNHGLIVGGDTPDEIQHKTDEVLTRLADRVSLDQAGEAFRPDQPLSDEDAAAAVSAIAPALRGLLAEGDTLKIVTADTSPPAVAMASSEAGVEALTAGPLTPDQIVYCGSFPMVFEPKQGEDTAELIARLTDRIDAHKQTHSLPPRVIVLKGVGILAIGDDMKRAATVRDVFHDTMLISAGAKRAGGIDPLSAEHRAFIEGWEAEAYHGSLASAATAAGRVAGKVALVTGAAQGFGLEIAQHLAAEGAHVALADINVDGARQEATRLAKQHGPGRAMGLAIDVSDGDSVAGAIEEIVRRFGGLDVLIANAGVLRAESVKTQSEKDFDFVTAVNYKGYYVCVQKVAPVLAVQHAARESYWSDVIQINSKSGLTGSNKNFAYAGSKFGGLGLTQSFALELVEDGVKVNSICPGNFYDGPLWSDPDNGLFVQYLRAGKVPGAKTVEDVRRAYEAKTPISRGCTTPDVMKAVYYLIEQQYETGQAVPVTGGQVMLK
jgi:rhamnose utilization protein RhaD (predicted bifunctional aldolase and dehydrogenase)/NAD(P)-dependent dehydrogenase (short-subunit alcohol dehydrogenase family)